MSVGLVWFVDYIAPLPYPSPLSGARGCGGVAILLSHFWARGCYGVAILLSHFWARGCGGVAILLSHFWARGWFWRGRRSRFRRWLSF